MNRPNILFILVDDMGWGDVSCHNSLIRTPAIDRLMAQGVELWQHYVQPMCTPTRASLMTGRYPSRFGPHATVPSNSPVMPDGYQTLAPVLRNGGYDTGLFGKWHLGSTSGSGPNDYGFNYSYGSRTGGVDPYSHRYRNGEYSFSWHRNGANINEKGHATDLVANEAINWMESRTTPWFCYVPFTAVHVPVKSTQRWLDNYHFEHYDDDPLKDASFKRYAGYASHMDEAVGKMVESLEVTGQRDNTIIIFTTDNGAIGSNPLHQSDVYPGWQEASPRLGSNLPLRGYKAQLYEGGMRTPTLINWRGHLEPGRMENPVHVSDWMPTLVNLVDMKPANDPKWDGQDIWPLLTGEVTTAEPRDIYWNFRASQGVCIRSGDWKLIVNSQGDGTERAYELFNIKSDPYEENEISESNKDKVAELEKKIDAQFAGDYVDERNDVAGYNTDPGYNLSPRATSMGDVSR